jgi:MFS family permease
MLGGVALAAVGIVALVPALGVGGVVVGGALMSLGTAAFLPANWAATADLASPTEAGRLMALANLGTALAAAAVGLLGLLIPYAGFTPALVLAAIASAAAALPLASMRPTPARTLEEPT